MKRVSIIMAVFFSAVFLVSCSKEKASTKIKKENLVKAEKRDSNLMGAPVISFDKEEFDFGVVNEGDVVEHAFLVTNNGESDLIITKAKASCGCTVPTWPKEAIAPGESAQVQVKFNTSGKKNKQNKTVTLTTNTAKGVETVRIKGMVTPKGQKPKA